MKQLTINKNKTYMKILGGQCPVCDIVSFVTEGPTWVWTAAACSGRGVFHFLCVCSQYAVENEELTQHLGAAKDAQRQLTAEARQPAANQHCMSDLTRHRHQSPFQTFTSPSRC